MVLRAMQHMERIKKGEKLPFNSLVFCNIGNPQELQQQPITFFRQVASLINYPQIITEQPELVKKLYPKDVIERVQQYLSRIPGGIGAYTHSQGIEYIREEVANYISARDGGISSSPSDIFLTDGASPGVQSTLKSMIRDHTDAVMVPIPQYPLYSASIALFGGTMVNYYLDEKQCWSLNVNELERSIQQAKQKNLNVRAIVIINPGNPTGNTLSESNMKDIVKFASKHNLVLLADEVYQENIWTTKHPWVSFKKVAVELGLIDPKDTHTNKGLQLISFHSTSKGYTGECGRRGGYMELCGLDEGVRLELYKLASISLCSNTAGQIMVGLMTNPPKPGDFSYKLYIQERDNILTSLKRRAQKLENAFNKLEGVSCQAAEGALYAFPQITLPPKAVEAAKKAGKAPDAYYCLALLDATGIVVVPGSGFGQQDGTFHFRSTILPPEHLLDGVISRMSTFHAQFMQQYK